MLENWWHSAKREAALVWYCCWGPPRVITVFGYSLPMQRRVSPRDAMRRLQHPEVLRAHFVALGLVPSQAVREATVETRLVGWQCWRWYLWPSVS